MYSIKKSGVENYSLAMFRATMNLFAIAVLFFVAGGIAGYMGGGLFIATIFFVIQYWKLWKAGRFDITQLSIDSDTVEICYQDRGVAKIIFEKLDNVEIKKKRSQLAR